MTATFSELIGFSRYGAIANDALKDEDNAAWVMQLEPTVQQEWVERSRWILLVDHLAESEYLYGDKFAFQDFQTAWKHLLRTGTIRPGCVHEDVFAAIYDRWFAGDFKLYKRLMIYSWDRYVRAMHTYHQSHLVIHTMKNYETLLAELGGTFFQIFPFLGPKHWQSARHFGALDQFFNILRDLQEDAEQGICYFPIELMQHFGVTRDEILSLNALENPGYYRMMKFLLDEYLPVLYQKVHQLTHAKTLHPSWEILRAWSLHRYQRIEYTFRQSRFDYSQFPRLYWPKVAQELPGLLSNLQRQLKSTNQEPQLKSSPFSLLPNFSKLTTIQVA